jgi:sphingolipid delta-4 desaturase
MGYHNEHHDLPSIPWNNLPKLRAMAPEFYENLKFHPSWSRLLFQFIFDQRYSLFSRIERIKKVRSELEVTQSIVDLGGRETVGAEAINV